VNALRRAAVALVMLMQGCGGNPTTSSPAIGGGTLAYHSEIASVPGDSQMEDGNWTFMIRRDDGGAYVVTGSGAATWAELAEFKNCSWEAIAVGNVKISGNMSNCQLTFNITIEWQDPQFTRKDCRYEIVPPKFDDHIQKDDVGPFPLKWGARISMAPTKEFWIAKTYTLETVGLLSSDTGCKVQ
jgi:hypothetical protein